MRKSAVSIVFLIALAAAVFFLGWTQFAVKPGNIGIVRSKTSGVHARVIRNGEFHWLWERLLPTNATLTEFTLKRVTKTISTSGELPSTAPYTAILGDEVDFSYRIDGEVSFTPRADSLPKLSETVPIADQADLDSWMEKEASTVADFTVRRVLQYAEDSSELERIAAVGATPRLVADIERAFPHLENVSCTFTSVRLPDFELYETAKTLYRDYTEKKRSALAQAAEAAASEAVKSRLRYEELERYGELLSKYPILLKYLAIEAGVGERTFEILKELEE